ncbi:hypothetical protein EDM54_02120 [Brevibacillus borstelensis]|uniref:XkdW family protein n=1 Tax=Brevibacillus borstelensis TaxID=45462 RepID=UPI000F098567|nr:hypothetical protein [Brevibacillus borstelensis]MED1885553.1 hypothetical protein [Brevibacillus borstelensis]RNB66191.1 hypothetical protein EDM54_02120 [Brevibacillus borstelensis]GED55179.1 hypothetical protein BBO01nite_44200 [Brevibacillus borstelensis]
MSFKTQNVKPISQIRQDQQTDPVLTLGQEIVSLKLSNMEKDTIIQTLGQELAAVKLELIQLKGGE